MGQPGTTLEKVHVYFGGSFDPPHVGHERMLETLLNDPLSDTVHLVPTFQNPLKAHAQVLSSEEKKSLIKLWEKSLQKKLHPKNFEKLSIEWRELETSKSFYTIDTMTALRGPMQNWVLAIGSDLLPELHKWHKAEDLISDLHSVWVFPRQGYLETLQEVPEHLRKLTHWRWMNTQIQDISSTKIREASEDKSLLATHPSTASFVKDLLG